MKKIFAVLAAICFLSGCANNVIYSSESNSGNENLQSTANDDNRSSDSITLKWGIGGCSITDYETELLNKKLNENGYNFSVDIIQLAHEDIMDTRNFSELVAEYETANGALDILTMGGDWSNKVGAAYNLIKDGYFRELNPSDKLLEIVPEALWSAAKVNGHLYTIPGQCFNDTGVTYYFNKKFVDESLISDFTGEPNKLENILKSVAPRENLIALKYDIDYLDYSVSIPDSAKGNIILNSETGKAENPFENATVIEYARALYSFYIIGYLNYEVNFSDYDPFGEAIDNKTEIKTEMAIMVSPGALNDLSPYFPEGSEITAVTLPCYVENRVAASTGISTKCDNPEAAMEFLELLRCDKSYSDVLGIENDLNSSFVTGLPSGRFPKNDEIIPSRFAGFELTYDKITDYTDIASALRQNYDRLCKADDFDKELSTINGELKASGIDDYIALVNSLLEEYNALANQ